MKVDTVNQIFFTYEIIQASLYVSKHKVPAINASPRFVFGLLDRFITQASAIL
jgi:hypothetical protein